jgi:hypothetical protein
VGEAGAGAARQGARRAQLTIVAQFRDKMPNAQCPKANLVLKKGSGNEFEGTISGSRFNYQLTLGPS